MRSLRRAAAIFGSDFALALGFALFRRALRVFLLVIVELDVNARGGSFGTFIPRASKVILTALERVGPSNENS